MKYTDLEIVATDPQVVKAGGKKRVAFKLQVPGVINEPVAAEYDAVQLQDLRDAVELTDGSWKDAMALGLYLADALLPPDVREALKTRLVQAEAQNEGLRVRLMLTGNDLNRQPWEFMLLNRGGGEAKPSDFLGLMRNVSIVRHPATPLPAWKVEAGNQARMAVAVASPTAPGLAPLKVGEERTIIEKAVAPYVANKRVAVTYANRAKVDDLPDRLHPAHLFHFAGHGILERTAAAQIGKYEGAGSIVLDDGTGDPDYLPAETLAVKLAEAGVRVAVLGACLTAQGDDVSVWGSVAESLLKAGAGAVLAMQYAVRDDSAIAFADKFYQALFGGLTIDEAVAAGRVAVLQKENRRGNEEDQRPSVRGWATPVLFLRARDGVIFPEYAGDPALDHERNQIYIEHKQKADLVLGKMTNIKLTNLSAMPGGVVKGEQEFKTVGPGADVTGVEVDF